MGLLSRRTSHDASGRLDFRAVQINATLRKREVLTFRRRHGEVLFEIASGEKDKSPYTVRKLWVSVDPTSRKWRVTRVDGKGPRGHTEYRSWTDAVRDILTDYPKADLRSVMADKIRRVNGPV